MLLLPDPCHVSALFVFLNNFDNLSSAHFSTNKNFWDAMFCLLYQVLKKLGIFQREERLNENYTMQLSRPTKFYSDSVCNF